MQDPAASSQLTAARTPENPTLPTTTPALDELFRFMAEAELRFKTLRLRIVDRRVTARGEEIETHEVWLRHPGRAKVISTLGSQLDRDYDLWLTDGEEVRTYDAQANKATIRRVPIRPTGVTSPDLPSFSQVYSPHTILPPESLADTFVHPHGFCRNVLSTGAVSRRGTGSLAGGREVILLRANHPRTSHVLTDRPDHWLEVGVDFQTGMILLLAEHVGDTMTRHAEATTVAIDEPIPDGVFKLHLSSDTRILY